MVPALAVGLAAGVTGGLAMAGTLDTTPYGEIQFNTAARNAHQAGRAEALAEAEKVSAEVTEQLKADNAALVDKVEAKLDEAHKEQQKLKRSLKESGKELKARQAKVEQLESALAQTNAALGNATDSAASGQSVEGTLKTTWTYGPKQKPWPQSCTEQLQTYQVRVTAGADATVANARLVGAKVVKREESEKSLTLTCELTYAAGLPTPLGGSYRFVVVGSAAPNTVRDAQEASSATLGNGSAPALSVTR
jgi:Skp family chaperone for outer membrane proteins